MRVSSWLSRCTPLRLLSLAHLTLNVKLLPETRRDLVLAGAILSILINPFFFARLDRLMPRQNSEQLQVPKKSNLILLLWVNLAIQEPIISAKRETITLIEPAGCDVVRLCL